MLKIKLCVMKFAQIRKCNATTVIGIGSIKARSVRCGNETGTRRESLNRCKL